MQSFTVLCTRATIHPYPSPPIHPSFGAVGDTTTGAARHVHKFATFSESWGWGWDCRPIIFFSPHLTPHSRCRPFGKQITLKVFVNSCRIFRIRLWCISCTCNARHRGNGKMAASYFFSWGRGGEERADGEECTEERQ